MSNKDKRLCPFCNEWIHSDTLQCPECGEYLPRKSDKQKDKDIEPASDERWYGMIHEF